MVEPKIDFFSFGCTIVFWNMEDYPIPAGADLNLMRCNIEKALGFGGFKEIRAYCEQLTYDRSQCQLFEEARVAYFPENKIWLPRLSYKPERRYDSLAFQIPIHLIIAATTNSDDVSLVVISKQSPQSELHRVQQCLKSRNRTLLLVEPPDHNEQEPLFHSVKSVVDYAHLLGGGGKPISKPPQLCSDSDNYDASSQMEHLTIIDSSKIVDFSKPIKPVDEDYTAIFWDVDDCPFPLCSNPDEIYLKIKSAFVEREFSRYNVSIWVYVDENKGSSWGGEFLRNKTWEANIYFLPGGDDKHNRMLNDILLFAMDSPVEDNDLASLIVVSDQIGDGTLFFGMLKSLCFRSYYVVLISPTRHINNPESHNWPTQHVNNPESHYWPGLLIDAGGYFFSDSDSYNYSYSQTDSESYIESESESEEPCHADAPKETPTGSGD